MGSGYAKGTKVPAARTEMEIRTFLEARGADDVGSMKADGGKLAVVTFKRNGLLIRMEMPLPVAGEQRPKSNRTGRAWSTTGLTAAQVAQEVRECWRNLLLIIKALFAAVDSGIRTFEQAFLADIVVPDSQGGTTTMGRLAAPAVREAYSNGKAPKLLTAGGDA